MRNHKSLAHLQPYYIPRYDTFLTIINKSIKTHLYGAIFRDRIRGA